MWDETSVNVMPQVTIERNYLVVGVHGKPPVVKVRRAPLHFGTGDHVIYSLAGTTVQRSRHDQLRMAARISDQQTFNA